MAQRKRPLRPLVSELNEMRSLMEEEVLKDVYVILNMISPVFHRMICGSFKEGSNRQLELDDVEEKTFAKLVHLACGLEVVAARNSREILELAKLADRLQISDVVRVLEDLLLEHMTANCCPELLSASPTSGLLRVENGCKSLALSKFEELTRRPNFLKVSEDVLASLLDDDSLVTRGEEQLFEAVVGWMREPGENLRGEQLLDKIRFPLMDEQYLTSKCMSLLPNSNILRALVHEAIAIKQFTAWRRPPPPLRYLSAKALVPRACAEIKWERMFQSRERRLSGHTLPVAALAECMGKVCSGSHDGTIRVWNRNSLEIESVLRVEDKLPVHAMISWGEFLITGHHGGRLRVWDMSRRQPHRVLYGHAGAVRALAVCGEWLLSGSADRTIRVWQLGPAPGGGGGGWGCERTLEGHRGAVLCLAVWEGKAISGSEDGSIRVWDLSLSGTTSPPPTIALHDRMGRVEALAACGPRLFSASSDGAVRVWAAGSWELLRVVDASAPVPSAGPAEPVPGQAERRVCSLWVGGGKLVGGLARPPLEAASEIGVWDPETLQRLHTLRRDAVPCAGTPLLMAQWGQVWTAVGSDLLVWTFDP